jgi:lipoprotein-anchoring transpeptidase ErfK/SrfK
MLWQDLYREVADKLGGSAALADERPILLVDCSAQCLHSIDIDADNNRRYPVSTALNGMGNRLDSHQTPFGIHRIREKIGGGEPVGMVFEARKPTGRIARDLDGLEEGVNRGGAHDTFSRYIYIHGTSDEKRIGKPVSAGCIRMRNDDVIELFDDVLVNDIVIIR